MIDIVERLRDYAENEAAWIDIHGDLFEAATAIETLRDELTTTKARMGDAVGLLTYHHAGPMADIHPSTLRQKTQTFLAKEPSQ